MKQYLLTVDKRGYGSAGETITLNDAQAKFLLLTQVIVPVPPATPPASADLGGVTVLPELVAPDAETGTDGAW